MAPKLFSFVAASRSEAALWKVAIMAGAERLAIVLRFFYGFLTTLVLSAIVRAEDAAVKVAPAVVDGNGIRVHAVESPYQAGRTEIRVLPPELLEPGARYPVVYVLPVEAGRENRYGDGLLEIRRHELHKKHRAIFVAPTFSHLPWYADHPSDPRIRQETYFLQVVVPFVEKEYPARGTAQGRLLLGFSKSGWGAWALLLRHPDLFDKAAAWDAPLMKSKPDQFGMDGIFATQENFEKHQIGRLLDTCAGELRGGERLILTGYGNFRGHHVEAHERLTTLGIPHAYRDGPQRNHDWHSGWVAEAVELLLAVDKKSPR